MKHSDHDALDADEVAVCPACDSSSVVVNSTSGLSSSKDDLHRYRCPDCNQLFDEFDRRRRASHGGPKRGMAKDLAEADPDEVSR